MNLKKTLAALSAGVVAVASMATLAASAQEAGSRTFDTFDVMYYAKGTVSATMASPNANETFTVDVSTAMAKMKAAGFDSLKVTKLKIAGDTYTDEEEINTFVETDKAAGTVTISALGLEAGKVASVTIEATTIKDDDKDDVKDLAEKAPVGDNENKLADAAFTIAGNGNPTVEGGKVSVKACSSKFYLQISAKADGNNNVDDEDWSGIDGSSNNWAADKSARLENLDTEVANTLAANRGAKLVFYFADKMDAEDDGLDAAPDYGQDTGWSDGETEDFAIRVNGTKSLTGVGVVDADALTISYDWDTVLAKSNLVNAVGQVDTIEFKANEDGFLYNEDYDKDQADDATYRYEITKIVVEWPASDAVAEDMSDLAAGEAETTVEAALPGAADTTAAAASTDAAANPSTGNSAVALAVIPVAIAAAAFVAKKRG
ncbi:MAG: hypothetical protein E7507_08850 [Ruminococcus sp.]|nr:hypothetical protein [Ruminococcus sp.]